MLDDYGQRQIRNVTLYLPGIAHLEIPGFLPFPLPIRSFVTFAYSPPSSPYRRAHRLKLFHSLFYNTGDKGEEQVLRKELKCLSGSQ